MKKAIVMVALAVAFFASSPRAQAWKCDRQPEEQSCTTTSTWDDRYDEGPYCEEPPHQDERPRCDCACEEDHGRSSDRADTPPGPGTTTSSSSTTTPTTSESPTMVVHQDPSPIRIDEPATLTKADTLHHPNSPRRPEQMTELPKTGFGGDLGLAVAGSFLTLGGLGYALGGKRRTFR